MQSARPTYINFCRSPADLQAGRLLCIPIDEAEALIARHRRLSSFIWIENFTPSQIPGFDPALLNVPLIDPQKMAVCYFGNDVGCATVAVTPIKSGEYLIFAGELTSDPSRIDPHNPYLGQVYTQKASGLGSMYVDTGPRGGFASMLMDLPSEEAIYTLEKKSSHMEIDLIATSNFTCTLLPVGQLSFFAMKANRDINPGEIMGVSYAESARLMYSSFIGFYRNGNRLPDDLNNQLNKIIYKNLRYRDLQDFQQLLHKVVKNIYKGNLQKAFAQLQNNPAIITELVAEELHVLMSYIVNPCNNINIVLLLSFMEKITQAFLEDYAPNGRAEQLFCHRELTSLVIESNTKQLMHKGQAPLHLLDNSISHHYVLYPGIARDFQAIGVCHERLGNHEIAQKYFRHSRLFVMKNTEKDITVDGPTLRKGS